MESNKPQDDSPGEQGRRSISTELLGEQAAADEHETLQNTTPPSSYVVDIPEGRLSTDSETAVDTDLQAEQSKPSEESILLIHRQTGNRYHILQHKPFKLLSSGTLPWSPLQEPKFSANSRNSRSGSHNLEDIGPSSSSTSPFAILQLLFFALKYTPVRLRSIQSMYKVYLERTSDTDWKTVFRMLFNELYGDLRPAKDRRVRNSKIHIPNCYRFAREGESEDFNERTKSRGYPIIMLMLECLLGCLILGCLVTFIGSQSRWFSHGQSSRTERAIMLLWACEGAFGLLLPLISLKEAALVFLLLPVYTTMVWVASSGTGFIFTFGAPQASVAMFALAMVPLGIFIAPVWGFTLVGRMLIEWGTCIKLY